MRISDWSSDVGSSDLSRLPPDRVPVGRSNAAPPSPLRITQSKPTVLLQRTRSITSGLVKIICASISTSISPAFRYFGPNLAITFSPATLLVRVKFTVLKSVERQIGRAHV